MTLLHGVSVLVTTDREVIRILFAVRRLAQKEQAKRRAEEEEMNDAASQEKPEEEKLQEWG